ncbi:MAG: hypothetical protein AB1486_03165 [Planctomycetota bacterium]
MRTLTIALMCMGVLPIWARAGDNPVASQNETHTDGVPESTWVVSIPCGSSDFFNTRFDGYSGRPIRGVSIGSADFSGGTAAFPVAGLFDANFTVDPTGNTPALTSGSSTGPVPGGGTVFNFVYANIPDTRPRTEPQHVVVQFPPGGTLLGVGADTSTSPSTFNGWTLTGYTTPAVPFTGGDWCLNLNIDAIAEVAAAGAGGRLRCFVNLNDETGDFIRVTVRAGGDLGLVYFGPAPGTVWMLFLSFLGMPVSPVTGTLPTIPDPPGGYLRAGTTWPYGFGNTKLSFVAVSGVPGVKGSVGISNEVTISTLPDPPPWGVKDDGSYESGWVVSVPAGPSDFFNVNFNPGFPPAWVNNVTDFKLAVMDFGTTATAYPLTGVFPANYAVDPSGNTPDLATPYESAPLTFPPGAFCTTSGALIVRTFAAPIPYASLTSDDVHGVVQFPPGPSLLAIGADTVSTFFWGHSFWTSTGYATPAAAFPNGNWGIRLGSN